MVKVGLLCAQVRGRQDGARRQDGALALDALRSPRGRGQQLRRLDRLLAEIEARDKPRCVAAGQARLGELFGRCHDEVLDGDDAGGEHRIDVLSQPHHAQELCDLLRRTVDRRHGRRQQFGAHRGARWRHVQRGEVGRAGGTGTARHLWRHLAAEGRDDGLGVCRLQAAFEEPRVRRHPERVDRGIKALVDDRVGTLGKAQVSEMAPDLRDAVARRLHHSQRDVGGVGLAGASARGASANLQAGY